MKRLFLAAFTLCFTTLAVRALATTCSAAAPQAAEVKILEAVPVAKVWSGHPVGFVLCTQGDEQYVAFYDANRDMTLAKRKLDQTQWQFAKVPGDQPSPFGQQATSTRLGWDSHNSIALAVDAAGQIHLSGNMHNNPLLYFRTQRPGDITSFRRIDRMVGNREDQVTYPRFQNGPDGQLVFIYRDGRSGNGADLYNAYDPKTSVWRRLLDVPLTDGTTPVAGQTAYAYSRGPLLGPDGYYHMVWVWRDTPDCETNHSLCYARSRDLVHWENSAGRPFSLPITPITSEVVDPVPVKGGMINNNTLIGFDAQQRVVLTYHKFDEQGHTQIYNARREADGWKIVPATRWNFRWDFSGEGSIIFEVHVNPVEVAPDGRLRQTWWSKTEGDGGAYLNAETLQPEESYRAQPYPPQLMQPESKFSEMEVRWAEDQSSSGKPGKQYVLRWETLPANRDEPRTGPLPEPSLLQVYLLETISNAASSKH
jgi:hypothetical protein